MRLPRPFYQLPVRFDADRLQAEVAALPDEAWAPHPDGLRGNRAARLISAGGAETDAHHGQMLPTPWLKAMPYLTQVLAGFGVVWSRSRLMRLAPGIDVPEHADINLHWHTRVRVHIPVFTEPAVRFHCDGTSVHMAPGEAWIFDNWRRHHVENRARSDRIHLVADTSGTSAFWQFALGAPPPQSQWRTVGWTPGQARPLLTESDQRTAVMPAAEVQLLVNELCADLAGRPDTHDTRLQAARLGQLLQSFVQDWRQLCALNGIDGRGREAFQSLVVAARDAARHLGQGLFMGSNGASALLVLEKRVLEHLVRDKDPT